MARTAEQLDQLKTKAVAAVHRHFGHVPDQTGPEWDNIEYKRAWNRGTDASSAVTDAVKASISAAEIAAVARVRQLLVAQLIHDPDLRVEALRAARHDAERYLTDVREAMRRDLVGRAAAGDFGEPANESSMERAYGVTRATVRSWLGKS